MNDDFAEQLGKSWRQLGEWSPPPLRRDMRERLVALRGKQQGPSFDIVWRAAKSGSDLALQVANLIGAALAPAQPALLRGNDVQTARILECRLGEAVLRLALSPDTDGEGGLRLAVSLDGGGEGSFNVELIDSAADDVLESRPLRQIASMTLRDGGEYCLAVIRDAEEIGRVRFRLDASDSAAGEGSASC